MNFSLSKRFSLLQIVLICLLVSIATFGLTIFFKIDHKNIDEPTATNKAYCNYNVKRLKGLKYIKPILFVDEDCQSDDLVDLQQKIISIINQYHTNQGVTTASVYIREYANNEWISINENEKYEPGSLFKVPILIAILKMNENNPGFLNKKVIFSKPFSIDKNVAYASKSIQLGQSYTINELLMYMIKYSDNNATALLETHMKPEVFQKLFSDIGLEVPNIAAKQYLFTVNQYSLFMRTIFNAGYLTINDSEFAAGLLTQCNFKEGIVKGLPSNIELAHKFGESGNMTEKQLHESAIIYLKNKPYLLTIMTKGKDNKVLSQLIAAISKIVYTDMLSDTNSI